MNLADTHVLALELLETHKLYGWNFQFDRAKVRFGYCNYSQKIISLSRHFTELNKEKHVKDTILHEIAHALVGKNAGHNRIWKQKAREIGCSSSRCYCPKDVALPKRKYTAICPHCEREFQRSIKRRIACGKCCKKYNNNRYSRKFEIEFVENK